MTAEKLLKILEETGFHFPDGATARSSIKAWEAVWNCSERFFLYPYASRLTNYFRQGTKEESTLPNNWVSEHSILLLNKIIKLLINRLDREKYDANVLVVGECLSIPDIKLMTRLLKSLVSARKKVIYLVQRETNEFFLVSNFVKMNQLENQVFLLDPWQINDFKMRSLIYGLGYILAGRAWKLLNSVLPSDISIPQNDTENIFREVATAQIAWSFLIHKLKFDSIIVRNHFRPLSASIATEYISCSQPVVTLQHGVISFPTGGFTPVLANKIVCYGEQSCNLLQQLDEYFSKTTGITKFCKEFIPGGSLIDEISLLPSQQQLSTLLVIDQSNPDSAKYYGIEFELDALLQTVRNFLEQSNVRKVLIRPHRTNKTLEGWLDLIKEFPHRIEISHQLVNLELDIKRSSIAIGLFSGALTTCAACGLPTFFLWEPGWYYTPDLSCFKDCFVNREQAVNTLNQVASSQEKYTEMRKLSIHSASNYHHNLKLCNFEVTLIDSLIN